MKKLNLSGIFMILFFFLFSYSDTSKGTKVSIKPDKNTDTLFLYLTVEELSEYNGKNGKPSYVAIDSFVYDVTKVKPWKNGNHKGLHTAGNVLTEDIKKSPHGRSVLKKLKLVGKIVKKVNE